MNRTSGHPRHVHGLGFPATPASGDGEMGGARFCSGRKVFFFSSEGSNLIPPGSLSIGNGGYRKSLVRNSVIKASNPGRDVSPYLRIEVKQVEAGYYRIEGSHDKCLKSVSEALEISANMGVHRLDHFLSSLGAQSALCANDGTTLLGFWRGRTPLESLSDLGRLHVSLPRTRERLFRGTLNKPLCTRIWP